MEKFYRAQQRRVAVVGCDFQTSPEKLSPYFFHTIYIYSPLNSAKPFFGIENFNVNGAQQRKVAVVGCGFWIHPMASFQNIIFHTIQNLLSHF